MESFLREGYQILDFGEEADVCFINTCAVTKRAEAKSRHIIRRVIQSWPQAFVIVAGCYPQLHPEVFQQIKGIDLILGTVNKFDAPQLIGDGKKLGEPKVVVADLKDAPFKGSITTTFGKHTRAFLKIQDGCDNRCSYCIVPYARGPSRSGRVEDLIPQAEELVRRGYKEIVLTGVHLGNYGLDLEGGTDLIQLLEALLKIEGLGRIRLSSIEPRELTHELLSLMAESDKICRHLHIPLQSGDDWILERMNRDYSSSLYEDLIWKIYDRIPGVGIGTDVIVGFPGEDEKRFRHTYDLIERLPLAYLHVFSFSPRKGAPAKHLPEQVDCRVKRERSQVLRALAERKRERFHRKFLGQILEVLPEEYSKNGNLSGLSDNYIRVYINHGSREHINNIVPVRVKRVENGKVAGEISTEGSLWT